MLHGESGYGPQDLNTQRTKAQRARQLTELNAKVSRPERVASEIKNRRMSEAVMEAMPSSQRQAPPSAISKGGAGQVEAAPTARKPTNASLPMAQVAKAKLEVLGWTAKGRAWEEQPSDDGDPGGQQMAMVTASRGEETISLTWQDGVLVDQQYSLWSEKPSDNGKPPSKLDINPNEMTDRELVHMISGMKVTWWNSLARSNESAIVGTKLTIEHVYDTAENGLETVKRLVKFVDHSGGGYRAFHVDALLKVG